MPRKRQNDAAPPEGTQGPPGEPPPRQQGKPPVHEIRIGRIRVTVWENEHATQGTWYSVTFQRSYKDNDGNWRTAHSFGRDDLLVLAEVGRLAWLWIATHTGGQGVGEIPVPGVDGKEAEIPI